MLNRLKWWSTLQLSRHPRSISSLRFVPIQFLCLLFRCVRNADFFFSSRPPLFPPWWCHLVLRATLQVLAKTWRATELPKKSNKKKKSHIRQAKTNFFSCMKFGLPFSRVSMCHLTKLPNFQGLKKNHVSYLQSHIDKFSIQYVVFFRFLNQLSSTFVASQNKT